MKYYFMITVHFEKENGKDDLYREYIRQVKPIVEQFGGRYLVRTEEIEYLSEDWQPDRLILIEFPTEKQMKDCFSSEQYLNIKAKRETSVKSMALIAKGVCEDE